MTRPVPVEKPNIKPHVWAIGGGKGGVGKSALTTGIAMTLAGQGQRCVMIDADLGGANLHTFLGMSSPEHTISDLFRDPTKNLQDILLATPFENLGLISGARAMLNVANLKHFQKEKLIRQVFSLEADYIFIDLGAGSSFNVLDFFIAAHNGLMVVTPTPTSIENTYHFLRAAYFRKLRHVIRDLKVEALVDSSLDDKEKSGIRSPRDLVAELRRRDPSAGEEIDRAMMSFSPGLIVNQVQRHQDRNLGKEMALACKDFLGIDVTMAGSVRTDEQVLMALNSRRPALSMFPQSNFAKDVRQIVQKLEW
ncbi:MAG: P-loop NTPase [Deltaproteobacteria bacterium]|jgi:flagellar biosynthesis protein FlhG|nr:P-loop NTPase [Deltaproteobacteria bacterium]